jgi:peptide/nickel transport system permease protein
MRFLTFLLSRLVTYVLVVWIGVTMVFLVPRFLPSSPVEAMLAKVASQGQYMEASQIEALRASLMETFGLRGTLFQQYTGFFKRVLLTGDFGPSFTAFPTPVNRLVGQALPWTLGLLLTSSVIGWLFGNAIGLYAGYRKQTVAARTLEMAAMLIYPIPYYIFALVLIILFTYVWKIFPFSFYIDGAKPFGLGLLWDIVYQSTLPALSIIAVNLGWWVISMKALATSVAEEDFVTFARLKGVSERRIMTHYVARNAMLPQVTILALRLGTIFNGALITEILFGFPGVGTLIYSSAVQADYNLMLGTISFSVIAVATATLIVDLAYPLLDPRIRYR